MMKRNKVIILVGFFVLFIASHTQANPVVLGLSSNDGLYLFVILSSMLVEYIAIQFAFRKWLTFKQVLPAFLLINFISFIFMSFLVVAIIWFIWFAEIVPIVIEPFMYKFFVCKPRGIKIPKLAVRVIIANLISFAYGIIIYRLITTYLITALGYSPLSLY